MAPWSSEGSGSRGRDRNFSCALLIVILRAVHARTDWIFLHQRGIERLQTIHDTMGICNAWIQPKIVVLGSQHHRHPIMYIGDQRVWLRCKYRARFNRLVVLI